MGLILTSIFIVSTFSPINAVNKTGEPNPIYTNLTESGKNNQTGDNQIILFPDTVTYTPCGGARSESACNQLNNLEQNLYQVWTDTETIKKQNEQIIKLEAYNYCKGTPTVLTLDHVPTQQEMMDLKNSGALKDNPFQDCVNSVLEKTK